MQDQYNWIDDIMKSVARQNDMVYQKDVKKLTVGTPTHFYDYLKANPNTTTYSILWCTDEFEIFPQLVIPCTFKNQSLKQEENDKNLIFYTIYYNRSLQDIYLFKPTFLPAPSNGEIIQVQNSVDNAILEHLHVKKHGVLDDDDFGPPKIKNTYSDYPEPLDRLYVKFDIVSTLGSYWIILGPLLMFMIVL